MAPDFNAAGKTFAERYNQSRENAAKPFGGDVIPPGTYVGRVRRYERGVAKSSGRNQSVIEIMIADGDNKGLVARQYQGLDPNSDGRDIGLEITLRTIQFFGYELPSTLSKLEDLDEYFEAITKEAPEVQFKFTMNGDFPNIELQKLLSDSGAEGDGDGEGEADASGEGEAETTEDASGGSGFEDEDHEWLAEFGVGQGVESIVDGMSKADMVAELNGQVFWTKDCTAADLKGTDADGQNPEDGIAPEDAKRLLAIGVEASSIVQPKPKAKSPAKAPAKAPAKEPSKKGKR